MLWALLPYWLAASLKGAAEGCVCVLRMIPQALGLPGLDVGVGICHQCMSSMMQQA